MWVIKIWQGGLSSFGGLFGAVLGFWLFLKRKKISFNKRNLYEQADILSFAAVFGWMVGRLGCFSIHDHIGKLSSSQLAVNFPDGARLEMAFLEILYMIPLAVWFYMVRKKQKPAGWFLYILFVYYGILRFVLDFFRAIDIAHADVRYFGLTPAQYFALLLVFFGAVYFRKSKKQKSTS